MRKLFLFTIIIIFLSSCNSILRTAYGIKNPQVEDKTSINKYAEKAKLKTDNIYAYEFNSYLKNIKDQSIPDVFIFDKNKEFIPYGDEYACSAAAFDFIENLNKNSTYSTSDKKSWNQITSGLTDLQGNTIESLTDPKIDFYVFIYWAKYAGKLNKDHVKIWEVQAFKNSTANLKLTKVNMDFQEFWGEENLNKLNAK